MYRNAPTARLYRVLGAVRLSHVRVEPVTRRFLAGIGLLLFLSMFLLNQSGGGSGAASAATPPNRGEILVKFKAPASEQAITALNASMATTQVDAIPALGVRVLRVPAGQDAGAVAAAYARNPLVQFAEVNALVKPGVIPTDPNFSLQWHLAKVQAPAAWEQAKATGTLIALCDTGVASVADLAPVLRGDLGWNSVDGSNNWTDAVGHGTLVAGAAAAVTNNGVGVAGVAWGAQIMPVRISNSADGSAYVSDAVKCINYAADHGARVINVSYLMAGSTTIDSAGQYAQGKGAVTTVAAGNNALDPGWPNYPGFVAVSATTDLDELAVFSNFGVFVDVAAPGISIMTTKMDGTYTYASGTSLSAPVAAGVLGLIFGASPGLSASAAQAALLSSSVDLGTKGTDPQFGYGRVNAAAAVAAVMPTPSPSPTATITPAPSSTATPVPTSTSSPAPSPTATATKTATAVPSATATPAPGGPDTTPPQVSLATPSQTQAVSGNVTLTASAIDNVGVVRVEFYVDGRLYRTVSSAPYSTSWNTRRWANGSHTIMAKAYDAAGNSASDSHTVTVTN